MNNSTGGDAPTAVLTSLQAEQDAAFDAGWKSFRDATVKLLRQRARWRLEPIASDLNHIADSLEAQTRFDSGRPPSPSATTAEEGPMGDQTKMAKAPDGTIVRDW